MGLFEVFFQVYAALMRGGYLQPYEQWNGHLLVALDGTEYFKSQKIHCGCCSSRTHKNGSITYFHQAILPVIVSSQQSQVIALALEFVTPQDGHEKQDCEVAAAKRWVGNAIDLLFLVDESVGIEKSRQPISTDGTRTCSLPQL